MRACRLIIPLLFLIASCKTASVSTNNETSYEEDLSYLRPSVSNEEINEVVSDTAKSTSENSFVGQNIKPQLDSLNKIIIERNKQVEYIDGYTIQVYTGNNRNAASEARDKVLEIDDSMNPTISYYQPSCKVKVGQYVNKLQAHKILESLKPHFPRVLLLPERIKVNYE